ncbi:MAG: hypothetical protein J6B28_02795 [Eubacterium sp.]|nr:hypothetical protein [Eubacterium sp.]
MSKKLPIVIGVIWLLAATALYGCYVWNHRPDGIYTYDNDGCSVEQDVYVSDNDEDTGYIYKMDLYGQVKDFVSTRKLKELEGAFVREVAFKDYLYALLEVKPEYAQGAFGTYCILEFDENLKVLRQTPLLTLQDKGKPCELSIDDAELYLTTVAEDGAAASIYSIPLQMFADKDVALTSMEIESFSRTECEPGRFYVDASYDAGNFAVRTDADFVTGPFEIEDSIRFIYTQCTMSFRQLMQYNGECLAYLLIAIISGWMVIFLVFILLKNRNRVVYTAIVLEAVLAVIVVGGVLVQNKNQMQLESESKTRWLAYVLNDVSDQVVEISKQGFDSKDFYSSSEYLQLKELFDELKINTTADGFVDLLLADAEEGVILASANGKNNETIKDRYFKADDTGVRNLIRPGQMTSCEIELDGKRYQILTVTPETMSFDEKQYALVALYENDAFDLSNYQSDLVAALIVFAIASLVCVVILLLQSSDLNRLTHSMQLVASGKTDIERPVVYGRDMRALWNALGEIQKKLRNVYYTKLMTFEAYYRFAPKNIEKLLNKASITEVECGNVAKLMGTMAMISTVEPRSGNEVEVDRLNRLLALLGKYQEEKDGVFVSSNGSLSMLRFLFMEQNANTLKSAIDFLKELGEKDALEGTVSSKASMLLHYSSFVYGVAGTNKQSSAFLISPDTEEIEGFATWFREHGLKLVISESVKEREHYDGSLRCIGYVQMGSSGKKMNMYEVLDVYAQKERTKKMALCEKFEQALNLFYQHDFYLARSVFSEVLKEQPTDELAKWYLFTCESYLNQDYTGDVDCCLRYDG